MVPPVKRFLRQNTGIPIERAQKGDSESELEGSAPSLSWKGPAPAPTARLPSKVLLPSENLFRETFQILLFQRRDFFHKGLEQ
jgi:hypothetical protein